MSEFSLDAGKLTKRVSIYAQPTGSNALNEPTTAGALVCKAWAELNPSAGHLLNEIASAGGDTLEAVDIWRVRYDSRIKEVHIIAWNSQRWRIVGIQIKGSKEAMDIKAVRVGYDDGSNL